MWIIWRFSAGSTKSKNWANTNKDNDNNNLNIYWYINFIFTNERDLVTFIQVKKRGKRPWVSVTFSKVADSRNVNTINPNDYFW